MDGVKNEYQLKTPVVFIIFKRLDTTKRVLESIRQVKPPILYIIADAPRNRYPDEIKKCEETRKYVEENIDWECVVRRNYADKNMGCKTRIYSGISWVFEQEEKAIILEDDVVPSVTFYRFCEEMLSLYQNNDEVMLISGMNMVQKYQIREAYTFSCFPYIWGWATWKRAWRKMDINMSQWPEFKKSRNFKKIANPLSRMWITWNFSYTYRQEIDTWDYPWYYSCYRSNGLGIVPRENLIENIGMNHKDSTHMHGEVKENFTIGNIDFPIQKQEHVRRNKGYDHAYIMKYFNPWRAWLTWNKKAVLFILRRIKLIKK